MRPLFRVFGIPVTFDPFFLFGALLVYQWTGGGRRGTYAVVALVVFVIIHELGHAFTAKAFGARPTVTVTFMGGFASYTPNDRMTTRHSVAISLAGALTQLSFGIPALWWTLDRYVNATTMAERTAAADVYAAVAWAGVLLAFLNLVPLTPLDGGHVVEKLLRRFVGERAVRPFFVFSFGFSILMGVMALLVRAKVTEPLFADLMPPSTGSILWTNVLGQIWSVPSLLLGDTLFIPLVTLIGSWQALKQLDAVQGRVHVENAPTRAEASHEASVRAARQAERESWTSGRLAEFPRGWEPSPWVQAHVGLVNGTPHDVGPALARLADGRSRRWVLDRPDREQIAALLPQVPAEAAGSLAVLEARVHHGSAEDLVAQATQRYIDERSAEPLYLGAAGLAVRGHDDEAMQWLERAVKVAPDPHRIATDKEFHALHKRSDFQQLLGQAQRAVQADPAR